MKSEQFPKVKWTSYHLYDGNITGYNFIIKNKKGSQEYEWVLWKLAFGICSDADEQISYGTASTRVLAEKEIKAAITQHREREENWYGGYEI